MNIYQRVHAIIDEGHALPKTGQMQGSGGNYSFHQVDEVLAFLRPLFARYRIDFSHSVVDHDCQLETVAGRNGDRTERLTVKYVECRLTNIDNPEEQIVSIEVGYGIDSQDKGPGKATSYAVKTYLINKFLLRGQPDEEQFAPMSRHISDAQVDEINELLDQTTDSPKARKESLEKLLKFAQADSLAQIRETRYATIHRLLLEKLPSETTADKARKAKP